MKKIAIFLVLLSIPGFSVNLFSQIKQSDHDAAGSHATGPFNRYPGSTIEYYQEHYQNYFVVRAKPYFSKAVNDWDFPVYEVRGDVLRILYSVPLQNTPEQCYEYYLRALKAGGYDIIFNGVGSDELGPPEQWYNQVYSSISGFNPLKAPSLSLSGQNHCYIAAKTNDEKNPVFITYFFEDDRVDWDFTIILMDVIYTKKPEKQGEK